MMDIGKLRKRLQERESVLRTERQSYMDDHVRDISELILPKAARFELSERNQTNESDYRLILDNTGTMSHHTLSSGLMAGLTSPARPWFRLATPDPGLMEYAPVKDWLFKVSQKMLGIYSKSNTYRSFKTIYSQLGLAGTAANVVVDDFENVLHNYPLMWGSYSLALNHKGSVDTLYRRMRKTVAQCVEEFGKQNCSTAVQNLFDRGSLDAGVDIIHVIEPRKDRDANLRDSKNMPYRSIYFEQGENCDKFLRESGFEEFPAVCPRWDVHGDDTYASSWPGAVALGDLRQMMHQQRRKGQAIDYQVNPPLQVPSSLRNSPIDALPGGTVYYDAQSQTGGIRSLYEVNLDLNMLREDIIDVRDRVRNAFFSPLFQMLANDDRSGITAREIAERHEEKLLMLGPVLESLYSEMLQPYIELTFSKMLRAGLFTEEGGLAPPEELSGQKLDVEFVSTLAQAQRAVGTQSIDKLVGTIGSLATLKPEALDKLDADQIVDRYAEALGVDPSIIVADDKVALIRSDRAQQQKMAAMAQMAAPMKDAATAAKTMGETEGGENLMSSLQGYT